MPVDYAYTKDRKTGRFQSTRRAEHSRLNLTRSFINVSGHAHDSMTLRCCYQAARPDAAGHRRV